VEGRHHAPDEADGHVHRDRRGRLDIRHRENADVWQLTIRRLACLSGSPLELLEIPVDLRLSKLELPGGDGRELARRALSMQPALRVVLMSGSHDRQGAFLAKPFTDSDLAGAFTAAPEDGRAA
jgi:CheY-like chemotaxis protein